MPKDEFLYLFCSKADKELILRSARSCGQDMQAWLLDAAIEKSRKALEGEKEVKQHLAVASDGKVIRI